MKLVSGLKANLPHPSNIHKDRVLIIWAWSEICVCVVVYYMCMWMLKDNPRSHSSGGIYLARISHCPGSLVSKLG